MSGDALLLLRGAIIGFSIAAPVGPIGVLCVRRTLADGRLAGFVTGLGAAAADTVYGALAALGLTAITGFLVERQMWVQLGGGAFLVWLGVRTLLAMPAAEAARTRGSATGLGGAFVSTFVLTLTNPLTILSFVGVFAGFGLGTGAGSAGAALAIVVGVFLGSAAWWLLLSGAVSVLRGRMDARAMTWVNRVSGIVILAFGLLALASAFKR